LEYLDLSNVTGFTSQLELGNSLNLQEVYAQGAKIPGVRFANQGALRIAKLPDVGTLEAKNLYNLTDFKLAGTTNLSRLVVENTPGIDTKALLEAANKDKLSLVKVSGINWELSNGTGDQAKEIPFLNKLYDVEFRDGVADKDVVLTGQARVPIIRSKVKEDYKAIWPEFYITPGTEQKQFTITFQNYDGKVLDV
jgi:hypothetical protein